MGAPTVLQVTVPPDQFTKLFALKTKSGLVTGNAVRRPTNGIVLKDDTFATLQVIARNGQALTTLVDAGSRRQGDLNQPLTFNGKTTTDVYTNFFIQSVSESREEKQQIMETFGDPYIFFFGQRARVMQFQGVLLNTWDFNWEAEWWENYENYLRGTRCVENDARVYLQYDNILIGGYILNCQAQKQAEQRNFTSFGFSIFITDYTNLSNPVTGDPQSRGSEWANRRDDLNSASFDIDNLERPTLLTSGFDNPTVSIGPDGKVAQGFMSLTPTGPSSLADSWRKTVGAVNQFFDRVEQVVNGTVIRVPEGFSGSMAYDAEEVTTLRPVVTESQTIAYSVFQQNDEEYIKAGGAYLTSAMSALEKWSIEEYDPYGFGFKASEIQGYMDSIKATRFWTEQGVTPDSTALVTLSRVAQAARLGLIAVNLARSIATFKRQPSVSLVTGPYKSRQAGVAVEE